MEDHGLWKSLPRAKHKLNNWGQTTLWDGPSEAHFLWDEFQQLNSKLKVESGSYKTLDGQWLG